MSALAEMLQGKETLWRELSAAWDCSLPGAAVELGGAGAASGAGLGLKGGTYYYHYFTLHFSNHCHYLHHSLAVKSLHRLTWIYVRRCGRMRFRRESGVWRQWGWRVWVVCTGCTAAAAAQPSSPSPTSLRWRLQQPHPWSLLSCWFHFVSCEGCSNIIANLQTKCTNNSVPNYSDRFATMWFMLFD